MIIKDEIYGTVEFDAFEEKVIDSSSFQRLRRIKQMSVTNLVYPGANHTRFEHSIGTAHLTYMMAKKLGLGEDDCRKAKIYGLLHDVGHTPFSHEGEDVLKEYVGDHEKLGEKATLKGELSDILSENYRPIEIANVSRSDIGSIVTSDIGSDRMDYLKRDALNTGVAYGIIDIDRIVHTLSMKGRRLCISKGGLEAAEYLFVARFMMFSAVYLHKTVRIATAMLYRAMEGAIKDGLLPKELAIMDDEQAMRALSSSNSGGKYASALSNRRLYKEVLSLPKGDWTAVKAKNLEAALAESLGEDIVVDYPHPFVKPVELEIETGDGMKQITKVSQLVRSLKSAEEERLKILIITEEAVRRKNAAKIKKIVDRF